MVSKPLSHVFGRQIRLPWQILQKMRENFNNIFHLFFAFGTYRALSAVVTLHIETDFAKNGEKSAAHNGIFRFAERFSRGGFFCRRGEARIFLKEIKKFASERFTDARCINIIYENSEAVRKRMAKYKKCPRCELNWIPVEEELCEVCKAEMGKASSISLIEDDDDSSYEEERICPVCKVNYLSDDEDICPACKLEQMNKKSDKSEEEDDGWKEFVEDDADAPISEEEEEISLSMLQEEEDQDADEEEEEYSDEPDDFDESITDFDEDDYDEDEEEDEDDEDL